MTEAAYLLCALTSIACAVLLARSYRVQRTQLLLWSTLCFVGLALNNIVLFVDLVVVPDLDLGLLRSGTALVAVMLFLIGTLWEDS